MVLFAKLLISRKRDAICLSYDEIVLDNNSIGLGCGFVCNLLISLRRDAMSYYATNQVRTRWRTGDGGKRVDSKGLDGRRDRTAGFLVLPKKDFLISTQKQCLLRVHYF